jgi:hypothetical protein
MNAWSASSVSPGTGRQPNTRREAMATRMVLTSNLVGEVEGIVAKTGRASRQGRRRFLVDYRGRHTAGGVGEML